MSDKSSNPEHSVSSRLGMSQLQRDLRALFRAQSVERAMVAGLARIGDYLGADYLVVHARLGATFLSEEFGDGFEPSDQVRDVVNGTMSDAMDGGQARCIRLRSDRSDDDDPTIIAAVIHDEEDVPAGAAAILLRECSRERAVEVFAAFEGILGFVSLLVTQPKTLPSSPAAGAQQNEAALIGVDTEDPVQLAFHIAGGLANRHSLDQVAVGLVTGKRVRVVSISGMDDVRSSNPGVKWIRGAMEEGLDAGYVIVFGGTEPDGAEDCDFPLHRQWSQAVAGDTVGTLPIEYGGRIVGVVAVRQSPESGLQRINLQGYQQEVAPYARLLPLAQRANRGLLRHLAEKAGAVLRPVTGSTWRRAACSIIGMAAIVYWLMFGSLSYSVVVTGRLAAADSQHISCPQDGTLERVYVEMGDVIKPGQVLAELDTHLDQLEAAELRARIEAKVVESDRALVEQSAVDRRVLDSQRRALEAQLAIVNRRIERGRVRAAVGGVIVAGDPRNRIGYPLQAGYELFQVACRDRVRIIMEVPEGSIVDARQAAKAELLLAASPDKAIEIDELRFPPAATATSAGMVFEVDATLDVNAETGELLPGMEGVVYMDLGDRNAWWVLTHRITDWLKMRFWI